MSIDLWDGHECARCHYSSHDVIADEPKYAVLECVYCGYVVRVMPLGRERKQAVAGGDQQRDPAPAFRFPSGRFVGKTLQEVDADPNGRRYIEFARQHTPEWRSAIEAYLFQET